MSVLLIFPGPPKDAGPASLLPATHPPLGICYLSSYLKSKDIPVHAIDLNHDSSENLKDIIRKKNIQVAGFSVTTHTFYGALEIARDLKKTFPYLKIVFGGNPAELFGDYLKEKTIDVLVLGRGEETMLELSRLFLYDTGKIGDIPDIMYFRGGSVIRNEKRKDPITLDSLPFPDRECLDLRQYLKNKANKQFYLVTSRYCPFKCNFCISGTIKNDFCMRSVENVVSEIRDVKRRYPFYNKLHFVDETLNTGKPRIIELCDRIKDEKIPWSGNFRFDHNMDDEVLEHVKGSGAVVIETGIESASQDVLDRLNKQIDIVHVEKMLKKAANLELLVLAAFIVPNYCDTPETLEQTVSFIERVTKEYMVLPMSFPLCIHPGTVLAEKAKEYGAVTNRTFDIIRTDRISGDHVMKALSRAQTAFFTGLTKNVSHLQKMSDFPLPDINDINPQNIASLMEQARKINPQL